MKKLIIFFAIRVFCIILVANFFEPRDYEYGEIARNLVLGNGFSRSLDTGGRLYLTSSHAPVYPFFLFLFYKLGYHPVLFFIIQVIQAILATFTILFVKKTAEVLCNRDVAEIASWLLGFYPPFIYHCTKLSPTIMFLFFLSFTLFLILKESDKKKLSWIRTGLCLGITILTDPIAFVLYPVIFVWFLLKKLSFLKFILIITISILTIAPWTIRNYIVHKRVVPVTTQFAVNFWIGNNPNATGTDFYQVKSADDYTLMTHSLPADIQDSLKNLSEIERADFYLGKAIEFIRSNPVQFFKLLIKKFYYYWWFIPSNEYLPTDREKYKTLLVISYVPILFFGLFGIALALSFSKDNLLPILVVGFISLLYIVAHVGPLRYRMPVEIYLVLYAAVSLNFCYKKVMGIMST
ncbi:MAG: glycosyltransferase family 39 protein [candidate division WOR-3 bacterium]